MTKKSNQPALLTRVRAGSALMDCGVFADLPANVFRRLCPSAGVCTFRHKAVLYSEGRRSRHVVPLTVRSSSCGSMAARESSTSAIPSGTSSFPCSLRSPARGRSST